MRKLLLIRHAKSSWKFPDLDDHERPLNKRGQRDILTIARHLSDKDEMLDVIYSSTATRALELANQISEFTNVSLVPDLSFYTFSADDLFEILRNLPDAALNVAVVAHNPAVLQVVNRLSSAGLVKFPTSAVAALECPVESWPELGKSGIDSSLLYFETPKTLTSSY